jgi:signal transduction histidine kinase
MAHLRSAPRGPSDATLDLARATRVPLRLTSALLGLVCVMAIVQIGESARSSALLVRAHDALHDLNRVQEVAIELQALEGEFVRLSDAFVISEFHSLMSELDSARASLRTSLESAPSTIANHRALDSLAIAHRHAAELAFGGNATRQDARTDAIRSLRDIRALESAMELQQRQILVARSNTMRREAEVAVVAMLIALALALAIGFFMQRGVERELRHRAAAEDETRRMSARVAQQAEALQLHNDELVEWGALLQKANAEAEAANRAKSEFMAVMSHELRTPLNAVIGFTNVVRKNKRKALDDTDQLYLTRIDANATHLLGLINQVLDFEKVQAGHIDIVMEPTDIGALATSVVRQLEGQQQNVGVELRADVPDSVRIVRTDSGKLRQVLINLVGNALKFTRDGDVTVRVVESASNGRMRLEVADTGIGMTDDRMLRIFDPFEQGGREVYQEFGGTGLGLSISRALCVAMGHELSVTSTPGIGSTFVITLG